MFQLLSGLVKSITPCNGLNAASAICTAQIANKGVQHLLGFLLPLPNYRSFLWGSCSVWRCFCICRCDVHLCRYDNLSSKFVPLRTTTSSEEAISCVGVTESEDERKRRHHLKKGSGVPSRLSWWTSEFFKKPEIDRVWQRVRLHRERDRGEISYQQWVLKAREIMGSLVVVFFFLRFVWQGQNVKKSDCKKMTPSVLPALNFISFTLNKSISGSAV